jgi:hypothetical protein
VSIDLVEFDRENSTMKKKRKDDDDSEYLHSSPPTKSRRLLDSEITMEIDEDTHANVLPQKQSNEERSLVLYHPSISNSNNTPLLKSPTSPPFTIVVKTHSIPGFKGNHYNFPILLGHFICLH